MTPSNVVLLTSGVGALDHVALNENRNAVFIWSAAMCFILVAPINVICMRPLYEADIQCDCFIVQISTCGSFYFLVAAESALSFSTEFLVTMYERYVRNPGRDIVFSFLSCTHTLLSFNIKTYLNDLLCHAHNKITCLIERQA